MEKRIESDLLYLATEFCKSSGATFRPSSVVEIPLQLLNMVGTLPSELNTMYFFDGTVAFIGGHGNQLEFIAEFNGNEIINIQQNYDSDRISEFSLSVFFDALETIRGSSFYSGHLYKFICK